MNMNPNTTQPMNASFNYAQAIQHCKALAAESREARAIRETRAKKHEWVIILSHARDMHLIFRSSEIRYSERHLIAGTVGEFLEEGGEMVDELSNEAAAEALREYIAVLDDMLEPACEA